MLVKSFGSALTGIQATTVTIEVNITTGISFFLVGLPDNAIKESLHRISAAFEHNGFKIPGRKITINLSPADIRKEGSAYDLPIAIGILAASGQILAERLDHYLIMGELSLDGSVLPIKGALPIAIQARAEGFKGFVLPESNAREAAVVDTLQVYGIRHLKELVDFLNGQAPLVATEVDARTEFFSQTDTFPSDFAEVKGQGHVKRALEIAAAGHHNVLLVGPPGSGKTMLAQRLPSIMPQLTLQEALETTKIHSVAGKIGSAGGLVTQRPFRAPHHLASQVAIVGGGTHPKPGEISLAHHGILFLDELPEFPRSVLEVMRQPLEDKQVTIARSNYSITYPANFMLVASMNPCPCGYFGHPTKACTCSPHEISKYLHRISGPLLDRIDMHIEVSPVSFEQLAVERPGESSRVIRERVMRARALQRNRFAGEEGVTCNAMMNPRQLAQHCVLTDACKGLLETAMTRFDLSARAYTRIIKLARTIADLAGERNILPAHLAEAIQYRNLDRKSWSMH